MIKDNTSSVNYSYNNDVIKRKPEDDYQSDKETRGVVCRNMCAKSLKLDIDAACLILLLGSSVSSTEKDIDTRLAKAWTAIDKLSVM